MITRNMFMAGNAAFEFQFTVNTGATSASDKKAAIPVNLYGQDGVTIAVDWGDGSSSVLTSADYTASSALASVHTYASAGTYTIKASSSQWNDAYLLSCYADATISSANNANQPVYWWRRTLKSVDSPLPPIKGVMRLASASATSMTASENDLGFLFHRCEKMTSLPASLFEYCGHIQIFNSTFYNCILLPSLPAGLMNPCVSATNFSDCFRYCIALTSIPVGFFKYCTAVTNMYQVFRYCDHITTVPADLFRYNTQVTNMVGAFRACAALKDFTLCIGSSNVGTISDFIPNASNVTRIVCVPANSTTYNSFNSYKNSSNNVTVSTNNADCGIEEEEEEDDSEVFKITVNTAAAIEGNRKTGIPFGYWSFNSFSENPVTLTVDWGDNTSSTLTESNYSSYADPAASVHEYAQAGTYTITVSSTDWIETSILTITSTTDITYNDNIANLYYYKKTLVSIDAPLPRFSTFYHSSPTNLSQGNGGSDGISDLSYQFCNCIKLQTVHSKLMKRNTYAADMEVGNTAYSRSIKYAFYNCQSLQAIPATLIKDCSISSMDYAFYGCSSLTSIPTGLFGQAESTYIGGNNSTLKGLFQNCTSLTSIPVDLFSDLYVGNANLSFNSCFKGCTSLTAIPETLLSSMSNASTSSFDLSNLFEGCTSLTSIPTKFFLIPAGISRVDYCFNGCTGISNFKLKFTARNISNFASFISDASNVERILCVPSSSTTYTNATSFANASNGVTVIGDGISCTDATWEFTIDTEATTAGATQSAIPFQLYLGSAKLIVDWGDGSTSVLTSSNYPYASTTAPSIHTYSSPGEYTITIGSDNWDKVLISTDTSSSNIPSYLVTWRQTLTSIDTPLPPFDNANAAMYIFYNCKKLKSIPGNLFINNSSKVNNVQYCFYGCSSLQSIPSGLFDCLTQVTTFYYCFSYCSSLTSIPFGLFDKNTKTTIFTQCFSYCTSLTSIPFGLFDKNTAGKYLNGIFQNCTSLSSIPPKLFAKNTNVDTFAGCFETCTSLRDFHLYIGSTKVTTFTDFVSNASNVDRIICVPANSTTYTTVSNFANNSNGVIVSTDIIDCAEAWEFTINTEAKTTGEKKTGIPFNLYNQSGIQLTVDWGDNTTSTLTSADYAQDNATASVHEYAAAGEYTVTIVSNNWENTYLLIVDDWLGSTKTYTHEVGLYYFQTSLITVNTALPALKGIMHKEPDYTTYTINKNFSYGFCSCEKLKSIPYSLFYNNPSSTSFYMCFYRCSSLISIPAGLFDRNTAVTDFSDCFGSCSSLKSIPAGLFDRNTAVTDFSHCFITCGILSIPSGLFANNTKVTDFSNCFMSCGSLLSIPSDLFANNTKVTSFSQCFNGCDSITSIPSGLFANNTEVTDFNTCFDHCNSLTHIPSDLFANNTKVTTFHYCFGRCPALTSIPSGLFDNNTKATNFSMCFINCTSLSFVPSGLFANNTAVTTFSQCFEKCSNLRSFHLKIGSPNVLYFNYLIYDTSSSTECTLCVPANSTSYDAANTAAQSYNIIVTTDYTECAETFEFTINTEATETGEKTTGIPFNLYGQTGVQLTVDWGDNTTSTLTSSNYTSSDSTASLHEYATAGEYTVTIVSNNWKNTYIFTASSISSYTNVNSALYWFRRTLTSIDSRLPKVKGISHSSPSTTTNNSLKYLFYEAAKLISIPSGLFDYNTAVTDFTSCFDGCSSIATIPSGLFDYNPAATDFSQCFLNCSSLQSIPVGMFNKNTSVTNFYRCFYGCSSLGLIPEGLFANNVAVTSFQGCFYGCQSLENFKLVISSKLVSDFDAFVSSTSNVTRIVCVPANSTTYTTLSNYAQTGSNVNNITVSTTDANCIQTFEYTIDTEATTANAKIATVPLELSPNSSSYSKLMIDWGDGNGVELTLSEITIENLTHTYSSSGEYQITVGTSNWLDYVFLISSSTSCTSLLQTFRETVISIDGAIPQITPSSSYYINTLNYWFFNCKHLITCSSHTFDNFSNVTSAINVFQNCTSLATIPSGLFDSNTAITSFTRCFQNCTSLVSIPSGLFNSNVAVTSFGYCFYGCTSLATIPSGLFNSNTAVTTFSDCFYGCTSLTTIPSGLFDSNVAVTSFEYCFYGCTSLASIPSGLFNNNVATSLNYCFASCTSLASIPSGLFGSNTEAASLSGCFRDCTSLTNVPSGVFNNTHITTFIYCFYGCTSLTTIPSGLFSTNTAVTNFGYCFYGCTSLASIPAGLFDSNTAVTSFINCFRGCTSLASIPSGLFDSNTAVTSFLSCFYDCTSLVSIPSGLFNSNVAVTSFGYCFHNCTSLASIPAGLFSTNTAVTNFYSCFNNCTQLTDFTINIGSSLVTTVTDFVTLNSNATRTINVPANSATYTAFSNVSSSLGLTIVGV